MYFYPHHIGDYKAATTYLSNEEDLAYRRLLELYYDTEKAIEDDIPLLAKRLRVTPESLSFVLKEFFSHTKDGWRNKRCDVVIKDYQEMAEKNRKNGKLGGRPKSSKQAIENPVGFQSVSSGIPVATQLEPNQEPRTRNQIKIATIVASPEGVSSEVWGSFVQHRKAKKAAITPMVMQMLVEQAKLAGWSLENALKETVLRNWVSFKAEWVANKPIPGQLSAADREKRRLLS
jgi:uncharacterized protein YdaU (DUF1376 family)